jgi:hypothetical protein
MASQMTLMCVGCGNPKGTTKEQYDKILALGKVDSYLCRSCRPKKTKPVVVKEVPEDNLVVDESIYTNEAETYFKLGLPDWMMNYNPSCNHPPLAKEEYSKTDTCFRPDIFYGNKRNNNDDGACDGCKLFEYCGCLTKVLKKKVDIASN